MRVTRRQLRRIIWETQKKQGYDDKEDESLGMRTGKQKGKKTSKKGRRDDSYGKWGKRGRKDEVEAAASAGPAPCPKAEADDHGYYQDPEDRERERMSGQFGRGGYRGQTMEPAGGGRRRFREAHQGYDAREDESLGMRLGPEHDYEEPEEDRRDDSYGAWGRRDEGSYRRPYRLGRTHICRIIREERRRLLRRRR